MDIPDKKAVKAAAKIAKKQAGTREASAPSAATSDGLTPAERSAQAAEHQVILQQRRVWLALLSLAVGVVAVLASLVGAGYIWSGAGPAAASQPAMTSPLGG